MFISYENNLLFTCFYEKQLLSLWKIIIMETWTTTDKNPRVCDKCGRIIPSDKGYLSINGWIICGICQYDNGKYKPQGETVFDPPCYEMFTSKTNQI